MPNGEQRKPFGDTPQGTIIYTADGYVSVNMMVPDRQPLAMDSRMIARCRRIGAGTEEDAPADVELTEAKWRIFASSITYQAYAGTYSLVEDTVTHKVELALWPEWVGTDLVRTFKFDGEDLRLTADNQGFLHELLWRRA